MNNKSTIIVVCILAVIIGAMLYSFIKRFASGKTCCGTEKVRFKKKKLKSVAGKVIFHVEGMHCNNCKASVENAVNKIDGLSAKVSLENKTLTVSYSPEAVVDSDRIISILGELGFTARRK